MNPPRLLVWLAAAALAAVALVPGCTRPEPSAPSSVVDDSTPYDDLARFVPTSVDWESVWFANYAGHGRFMETVWKSPWGSGYPLPARMMWVGRRFSRSDEEGLAIMDWVHRAPNLHEQRGQAVSRPIAHGHAVYLIPGNGPESRSLYFAVVDDRFEVFATRRSLIDGSLARSGGTARALVARLGFPDVGFEDPHLIVRKYDPTSERDLLSPVIVTEEPVVGGGPRGFQIDGFALRVTDWADKRFTLRVATSDPEKSVDYFNSTFLDAAGARGVRAEFAGGVLTMSGRLAEPSVDRDCLLLLIFGMNVFV